MKYIFIKLIAVLAVSALACQISFNLPLSRADETTTFTVSEPLPADDSIVRLELEMGAGEMIIDGGSNELVSGTIAYNLNDWEPIVERDDDVVRIYQDIETIPFSDGDRRLVNQWDLQLGNRPMELDIDAGAYEGDFNLGGVPLLNLDIRGGASNVEISFDEPNPVEMSNFHMETGASNIVMRGLANANFDQMEFAGAAGNYSLDFSGELQSDADVYINGAVGDMTIIVPVGQAAQVTITGDLQDVNIQGSWQVLNDVYTSTGDGPVLTINVEMTLGNLELISR